MKNLVLIQSKNVKQFEDVNELYENIFGRAYFQLKDKERFIKRYELAFYLTRFYQTNLNIVHTKMGILGEKYTIVNEKFELQNSFLIDDERTFTISLCKISKITLLESKFSNQLLTIEQKAKYKGNFIILNKIVNQLLED